MEPGDRVDFSVGIKDKKTFNGSGVYLGDADLKSLCKFQLDTPQSPELEKTLVFSSNGNPIIRVDENQDGEPFVGYVWGCECWWSPVTENNVTSEEIDSLIEEFSLWLLTAVACDRDYDLQALTNEQKSMLKNYLDTTTLPFAVREMGYDKARAFFNELKEGLEAMGIECLTID
jgi:hypothetical protein